MKKRPVKVQRKIKDMRDETKRMIAEMLTDKCFSKINAKHAASHTVRNNSYMKTFTVYAFTLVMYHRRKQKAMLLKGNLDGVIT